VQNVEAGAVGGEPGALDLHATEGADVDVAVGFAAPGAAPVLQLHHFGGATGDEVVDDILLAQPIAAGDGVVEVVLQAVVALHDAGRAALGRHGMAAHREHLETRAIFSSGADCAAAMAARRPAPPAPRMRISVSTWCIIRPHSEYEPEERHANQQNASM